MPITLHKFKVKVGLVPSLEVSLELLLVLKLVELLALYLVLELVIIHHYKKID